MVSCMFSSLVPKCHSPRGIGGWRTSHGHHHHLMATEREREREKKSLRSIIMNPITITPHSTNTGWWFQTFFISHNIWDNPSHWLYFSRWLKPPTRICFISRSHKFSNLHWPEIETSPNDPIFPMVHKLTIFIVHYYYSTIYYYTIIIQLHCDLYYSTST